MIWTTVVGLCAVNAKDPPTLSTTKNTGMRDMIKAKRMVGFLVTAACLLTACGGGGGNAATGRALPADRAGISISPASLDISVGSNSESGLGVSYINLDKAVPNGFYYQTEFFGAGISNVSVQPYSDTYGALFVDFIPAQDLAPGVYSGRVRFTACEDTACTRPLRGSPFTIPTRYTVPLAVKPTTVVSLDRTAFDVEVVRGQGIEEVNTAIRLSGSPQSGLYYYAESSKSGIESVDTDRLALGSQSRVMSIRFRFSRQLDVGSYEDQVRLSVCHDSACRYPVQGSPLNVTTHYTVLATPRPDAPVLPVQSSLTLLHDIVDAEYVSALDAVAIVSQAPDNRFYLYEPASNRMRSVALSAAPRAVSVSPDGGSVVVGHDMSLSLITLPASGSTAALSAKTLMLSINTADAVFDGNQMAHVFPAARGSSNNISTVRTALGIETQSTGNQVYNGSHARLHPNGKVMYAAQPSFGGVSGGLSKFSISSLGLVNFVADNAQRSQNGACGNLWLSSDGLRIYTACGYVFTSADVDADDMRNAGRLPLTRKPDSTSDTHRVASLASAGKELALIERDEECRSSTVSVCRDHLRLVDAGTLAAVAIYTLPNRFSGNDEKQQEPLMVFQAAQNHRYVLSRAIKPGGEFEYYLLTSPRG